MTLRGTTGLLALATVFVGAIIVAPALGGDAAESQGPAGTDLSASVDVSPRKAGTKQHPQGVTIRAQSEITTEPGLDPPIVTGIDLQLGRGLSWNGSEYATCSKQTLKRLGPTGCPRESILGSVIAHSRAGTVHTRPQSVFVNGGEERMFAYTRLEYPARVQEAIPLEISELSDKWPYKGVLRIPRSLQVVAGIPIQTTRMNLTIGGKPYAPGYITSTDCPKGGWRYQATTHYRYDQTDLPGQDTVDGTVACTN